MSGLVRRGVRPGGQVRALGHPGGLSVRLVFVNHVVGRSDLVDRRIDDLRRAEVTDADVGEIHAVRTGEVDDGAGSSPVRIHPVDVADEHVESGASVVVTGRPKGHAGLRPYPDRRTERIG